MLRKAPGIPIRIQEDTHPLGRLYISHRQMWLEFPTGVSRRVIDDLFPGAEIRVDEEEQDGRITKARIVSFVWRPVMRVDD
jgi:hypothetical protein